MKSTNNGTAGTGKTADHLAKLIDMARETDTLADPEGADPETLVESVPEEKYEEVLFEEIDEADG